MSNTQSTNSTHTAEELLSIIEQELADLQLYYRNRALARARTHRANLHLDDMLNPDDYPEVVGDPHVMYEEGAAAGVLAAKIALRAKLLNR